MLSLYPITTGILIKWRLKMLTITYFVRNSILTTALIGILFLEPCILPRFE